MAARNCRKRKIDQIKQLEDDVGRIRNQKGELVREHERLMAQRSHWTDMVKRLHDHVPKVQFKFFRFNMDPKFFEIIEIDVNYNCHIQYILGAWTRSKPLAASNGSQSSGSYFTTKSITRNGPS